MHKEKFTQEILEMTDKCFIMTTVLLLIKHRKWKNGHLTELADAALNGNIPLGLTDFPTQHLFDKWRNENEG
jgi:hypothetical protein